MLASYNPAPLDLDSRNDDRLRNSIGFVEIGPHEMSSDQSVDRHLRTPRLDKVNDTYRIARFQRALRSSLWGHACSVSVFCIFLLVVIGLLGGRNVAVFWGLVGYLVGNLATVLVTLHTTLNAFNQFEKFGPPSRRGLDGR